MKKQDETTPPLPAIEKDVKKPHLVSDYERIFSHFDKNRDGKISPADLQQCLEDIGLKLSTEETEAAVAYLDMDGDELLTLDDLVCFLEGWNEEDRSNDLKEAFEMYEMDDFDFLDTKFFGRRAIRRLMRNYKFALVKANRGTNRLPVTQKDLKNIALEQKALNCTAIGRMLDISPKQHGMLLMLCGSILSYLARNSTTTTFEFQVGKTKDTPQSLLSFHEASFAFIPEMAHITVFMICYILTWMLVLPLQPGVQIFMVLLLISAPLFYFPDLVRKASNLGVDVACGNSCKLPLIGFTSLGAFGITLTFGLLTLLVVYLNRRFIQGRKLTGGQDIEVNSNDLIECLSDL